jgi:hypothetical protein
MCERGIFYLAREQTARDMGVFGYGSVLIDDVPVAQEDRATSNSFFETTASCPDASSFLE